MTIRTFTTGDDATQVSIYNEAAADLPKFKPVTLDELRRRLRGPDFDPTTRFFAVEGGRPVGYAAFHRNGRVSFPWCRKGREEWADPLLEAVLQAMRARGLSTAFAAYRVDWPVQRDFFLAQGFTLAREMINFVMELVDMPTPSARPTVVIEPMTAADAPAVLSMAPKAFGVHDAADLERHLLHNPYFPPGSAQVLRKVEATALPSASASSWKTRPMPTRAKWTPWRPASALAPWVLKRCRPSASTACSASRPRKAAT